MRLKLKEARIRRALTQAELAELAGMTESTVNRIENGLQEARMSTLRKLATALKVEPEELIDWGAGTEDAAGTGKAAA